MFIKGEPLDLKAEQKSSISEDEIDLRELAIAVWEGKWVILPISIAFLVVSILYAFSVQDEYRSTALLVPASASSSTSLSKLAGQFGGLASLAGVSLGGGGSGDKSTIAIELIKTRGFLEVFIKNNGLEVEVFAVNGWDKLNNKLLIDSSVYDEGTSSWKKKPGTEKAAPSSWKLFSAIENRISVNQDKKTGLILLSVEHYSPVVAKRWVDLLVLSINRHIQMRDREEALNSIEYLKTQIGKTRVAEMQAIFYQLIEEQTKTLMLAESSREYVFKTLSPAMVAEIKAKPKRAQIVVLGGMFGGMFSVMCVLIRYFVKGRLSRESSAI
ncbi:MAG: hypothetical protein KUG82_03930 [Pseudomonadales bacterium]|nr:hypothetical protein [Pseudomonadales bacterium]